MARNPPTKGKTKGGGKGTAIGKRTETLMAMDNVEVKKAIKQHCSFLKAREAARKKINQEISASRNALVARGLNRKALTIAEAYAKMEDQHRDGFDTTLVIARKAIGYPMQAELFAAEMDQRSAEGKAKFPDDDDDGDQESETELEHAGPGAEGLSDADVQRLCDENDVPYDEADPGGSYAALQAQLDREIATPDDQAPDQEARTH